MENLNLKPDLMIWVILTVLVVGALAVIYIMFVFMPFLHQRKYLRIEYDRAVGSEKKKWKRRLIRLYLSIIPLIGPLAKKLVRSRRYKK